MNRRILTVFFLVLLSVSCEKSGYEPVTPEERPVTFMVLSDIHYMHPDILVQEGKAWEKYNWEECKLLKESNDIFNAVLDSVRAAKPDFVLVCGDMTKDGEVLCHSYVAEAFEKLEKETGTTILVIPGNHDMNNPHSRYYVGDVTEPALSADEATFGDIYRNLGYSDFAGKREGYLDYMSYPVDGIAVIGVDSNEKNTSEKVLVQGGLSREQVAWIKEMAAEAHKGGRHVIMMMHHNLVDFYDNAQLIRGANIANARYDYTNQELVNDLCAAGVDVVFSGHSHMHSITSATVGSHTIYSVVTSSMVNLPLAFRKGTISRDGTMRLWSSDVKDCRPAGGVDLRKEGDRYWMELSGFYMYEASRVVWESAEGIVKILGFKTREELQAFFDARFKNVFYTFLTRTSDGNEHLVSPKKNLGEAMDAVDGLIEYIDEKLDKSLVNFILRLVLGVSLDDVRTVMCDFFSSAYFNYLGNGPVMPDDSIVIPLS